MNKKLSNNLRDHIIKKIETELNFLDRAIENSKEFSSKLYVTNMETNTEKYLYLLDRLVEHTRDIKVCHKNLEHYEKILNGD